MIRHHDLAPFAYLEINLGHSAVKNMLNLFHKLRDIKRNSVCNYICNVRKADSARKLMKRKFSVIVDDSMSGVGSALKANDHIRLSGKHIGNFSLSLIAPVCADDCSDHNYFPP